MKLEDLKKLGGIIAPEPIKQEVTVTTTDAEGETQTYTFDVFVKRLSFGDYERLFTSDSKMDTEDEIRSRQAVIISVAASIGESGEEAFSYADAYQMDPNLAGQIIRAINKVNGRSEKKPSLQPTSSGTS